MSNDKRWKRLMELIDDMQDIRDKKFANGEDGDMIFVKRDE